MSPKRRRARWLEIAREKVERRKSGVATEADLIAEVQKIALLDMGAAQYRFAKSIVRGGRKPPKPGSPKVIGQFVLPLDRGGDGSGHDYDPSRLMAAADPTDGVTVMIEADAAPEFIRVGENRRIKKNFDRVALRKARDDWELEIFQGWIRRQRALGRPENELTWGNCWKELGLLRPIPDKQQRA